MRCPWCANPEGLSLYRGEDIPAGGYAVTPEGKVFAHTPESLLEEALSCSPMFWPDGGVTFTGGEPTLQFEPLAESLALLHEAGINTALESNASHPKLPLLFDTVDFLMLDLKQANPECHLACTGVGIENVLRNIKAAAEKRDQLAIRIPLIGGYNSSDKDMEEFLTFFSELPSKAGITLELLSYHEYGVDKWKKLGLEYTVRDAKISRERYKECVAALAPSGVNIIKS